MHKKRRETLQIFSLYDLVNTLDDDVGAEAPDKLTQTQIPGRGHTNEAFNA